MKKSLLLLFFVNQLLIAQSNNEYIVDVWTSDNGLPQNTVNDIYQTEDGYLWIATFQGLVRFDGNRFTLFNAGNTPGMNSNRITDIYPVGTNEILLKDESGIWSLTKNGEFISFNSGIELRSYFINRSFNDKKNDSDGILLLTNRGVRYVKRPQNLPTADAFCLPIEEYIFESRDGIFYSRRGNKSIYSLKIDTQNNCTYVKNLLNCSPLYLGYISEDSKGNLWTGLSNGVLYNNVNDKWKEYSKKDFYSKTIFYDICEDKNGNLWCGSLNNGIIVFNHDQFFSISKKDGLSDSSIKKIFIDKEGSIWLGTNIGGLNRLRRKNIRVLTQKDGLTSNSILSIHEDREGGIWIGTNGNGVSYFKDNKFASYLPQNKSFTPYVWSTFSDKENTHWFGMIENLLKLKNNQYQLFTTKEGLVNRLIRVIYEDRKNNLWIGTIGGLSKLKDGVFSNYTVKDGLCSDFIISILEDRNGAVWIGTNGGGISCFKDNKFTNYSTKDGLSNDVIRAIYEDREGILWFGTYGGGLNRFVDGKFSSIRAENGLFDDVIHNIIEDDKGNFWMSCNKGIYYVNKKELNDFADGRIKSIETICFRKNDGMLSDECNGGFQPSVCKTTNNQLWYPTINGIAIVDLNNIIKNEIPPPVIIEKMKVDSRIVDIQNEIVIPAGGKKFEFEYTALCFLSPEKVKFKIKLEGFDDDWIELKNIRFINYTNLSPGEYSFRVIACNNDGIWNNAGASIKFVLKPYYYQSAWFYVLVGILLSAAGFVIYKLRIWQLLKREQVLKERVSEAMNKIKILSGLIPICANCKKIRDDKGYWNNIEKYIKEHSQASFTHGICPECVKKLYPDLSERLNTSNISEEEDI